MAIPEEVAFLLLCFLGFIEICIYHISQLLRITFSHRHPGQQSSRQTSKSQPCLSECRMCKAWGLWHCQSPWSSSQGRCVVQVDLKNSVSLRESAHINMLSRFWRLIWGRDGVAWPPPPAIACRALQDTGPQLRAAFRALALFSRLSFTAAENQPQLCSQHSVAFFTDAVYIFCNKYFVKLLLSNVMKLLHYCINIYRKNIHLLYKPTAGQFKMNLQKRLYFSSEISLRNRSTSITKGRAWYVGLFFCQKGKSKH